MTSRAAYDVSAEDPDLKVWAFDDDGSLINLAAVGSWSLKIGSPGSAALLTKTTGITGAAGSGTEIDGTPNIVVQWSAGELDITPGAYLCQITATTSSRQRVFKFPLELRPVIT